MNTLPDYARVKAVFFTEGDLVRLLRESMCDDEGLNHILTIVKINYPSLLDFTCDFFNHSVSAYFPVGEEVFLYRDDDADLEEDNSFLTFSRLESMHGVRKDCGMEMTEIFYIEEKGLLTKQSFSSQQQVWGSVFYEEFISKTKIHLYKQGLYDANSYVDRFTGYIDSYLAHIECIFMGVKQHTIPVYAMFKNEGNRMVVFLS